MQAPTQVLPQQSNEAVRGTVAAGAVVPLTRLSALTPNEVQVTNEMLEAAALKARAEEAAAVQAKDAADAATWKLIQNCRHIRWCQQVNTMLAEEQRQQYAEHQITLASDLNIVGLKILEE